MVSKEKAVKITEDDFFSAIFAILALNDYDALLFNQALEEDIAEMFQEFKEYAEQRGAELRFRIQLHWFHGDSQVVHRNIISAARRGILSFDSPGSIIRIKLTKGGANAILDSADEEKLFINFADRVIQILSH